jgi:hypothetical protein
MNRGRASVSLAVSIALFAALAAPADATFGPFDAQNGKIAFTAAGEINTINPDGTGRTNVTNDPAEDDMANWSPDGLRFSFFRAGTNPRFRTANADGSGVQSVPITLSSPTRWLDWAPNGQRVAYADGPATTGCLGYFQYRIFTANLDGTGMQQLTPDDSPLAHSPAWSPDGTKIAFLVQDGEVISGYCFPTKSYLYVMNADGSGVVALTATPTQKNNPDWSPDGTKIAYDVSSSGQIWTINANGTGATPLTTGTNQDSKPSWSPDGTKIAFARSGDIYVMNTSGPAVTNVTNTSGVTESNPDWQPVLPPEPNPPTTHDHPRVASPLKVSLVPNYRQTISATQCQARGGTPSSHGAPLSLGSCNPPAFAAGTQAHIGRDPSQAPPPQSNSWASYTVVYGDTDSINGDQADMALGASLNDIRTAGGSPYDPNPSGADLTLLTRIRITDRFNGASQSDPATVQDVEYGTPIVCSASSPTCSLNTSADAITPNTIRENKGTVIQVFRFRVNDSGVNGTRGDADDRTFATQGIYIP